MRDPEDLAILRRPAKNRAEPRRYAKKPHKYVTVQTAPNQLYGKYTSYRITGVPFMRLIIL